ncbi:PREDICTED: protein OBERON 4-like isoform X3 [Camelina sativa]|uniref:Protein OBERON 4-like isoform X3 n=1 Tax=Camelina sativa TaxID=90675 RepID=A0ABM0SLT0_CAMSA|nr:PREDICTED: protein OBERON 4-like isoform X3 [Camelina sativa]
MIRMLTKNLLSTRTAPTGASSTSPSLTTATVNAGKMPASREVFRVGDPIGTLIIIEGKSRMPGSIDLRALMEKTTADTESNRELSHVGEMETAKSMTDQKTVEEGENVPEHASDTMHVLNDTSTASASELERRVDTTIASANEITDMVDDNGDNSDKKFKENHEVKLEESLYQEVPQRFQVKEFKEVKDIDGDANEVEVEGNECVEETALANRTPSEYISIVSDSSVHKRKDKGTNSDVPLTHLLGNALFSERKSEDLSERDEDEKDDNFGGRSIRGFQLFSSSPVRRTNKTEQSSVSKPKDEKLLLEPLDLSLSLPDVLLPIGGQDTNQPLGSPFRSGSVRSLTDTFCTNSDGFTMSMSFSGSRSFNHNPSCSLNHNIGDNEQSVHSRPIFQGIDWQALSHNDSKYNENIVYQRLMENGSGSVQPQAMKGILISGQADEEHLRLTDGSSNAANRLEKQLSFQKIIDARLACSRTDSLENGPKFNVEKKKAKDFCSGSNSWINGLESGGHEFVETVIGYILSDSMHLMTKRFHEMPTRYITSLKENIRQMMLNMDKNVQLGTFQDALQNRTDITLELLTKSHRAQLEILVALKVGRSDFLQLDNSISSSQLAEIYMNMRCKNISCRVLVPVDECDCRVCLRKDGFCSACMCLVCSNFDMASNTCSWVGCDVCLHWCHTDCGIRESYIRNGINDASGAPGITEMQFHCVACNHPSEMFGFVKEVFLNFASEWKFEHFCKELEYVKKIFSSSKDSRGKQLRQAADAMLASLKSKSIGLPEACNRILGFISDCDSFTPGKTSVPFSYEQPKPRHERGSPSKDTAWLRSVCSDKPHHQLKRSASVADVFHRETQAEICGVEIGLKRGLPKEPPHFEELESIVRMKQAEAEMFQGRADDARREAEGLKRIAIAKKDKIEEEYKRRIGKLSMEDAEERRRWRHEELEAIERGQREFYEMKMRMEEEMSGLLTKMEVTKQSLAL